MSRKRQRRSGRPAIDLIEEGTHLLRLAPAVTLLSYFVGTGPFVLGLLYFWSDMSRGAFADQRVLGGSLGLALLFIWMRTWQTVFMVRLRAQVTGRSDARWNLRRWLRAALVNAILQPSALVVLPVSFVLTLPAPWAFAFYQSATALADSPDLGVREVTRRSWRLARLWTEQGINVLLVVKLFALFVFLNVLTLIYFTPQLLKMFLGVESAFTLSIWSLFNTTVLMAAVALTYLLIDPLLRAVYLLRCHYGDSLQSGEDLLGDLRTLVGAVGEKLRQAGRGIREAVFPLCVALCLTAATLQAAPAPATPVAAVEPAQLDRALDEVLDRAEFNWRLPRERSPETDQLKDRSWLKRQLEALVELIEDGFKWLGKGIQNFFNWLGKFFRPNLPSGPGFNFNPFAWLSSLQTIVWILLVLVVGLIAFLLIRAWLRRRPANILMATAVAAMPDLRDEDVGADELPEDGWLQMAREQLARGDLRLALRALYLASLAHLAERGLVKLEKFKSNRDYEREVLRRARALPVVQEAFSENVGAFDRAWYGLHEVTRDGVDRFERNLERIKSC